MPKITTNPNLRKKAMLDEMTMQIINALAPQFPPPMLERLERDKDKLQRLLLGVGGFLFELAEDDGSVSQENGALQFILAVVVARMANEATANVKGETLQIPEQGTIQ